MLFSRLDQMFFSRVVLSHGVPFRKTGPKGQVYFEKQSSIPWYRYHGQSPPLGWHDTVDGRNPAPPKTPWNDHCPVNTKQQYGFPWFQSGAKWTSSIHSTNNKPTAGSTQLRWEAFKLKIVGFSGVSKSKAQPGEETARASCGVWRKTGH